MKRYHYTKGERRGWGYIDRQIPDHIVGQQISAVEGADGGTILIVEDKELNMKLLDDLPESKGYNFLPTRDSMEILNMARSHMHMPDLILMDIQLPEVSGLEVTKWLKENDNLKVIPVVAVTAFAMKGDKEKIREGGYEAIQRSRSS